MKLLPFLSLRQDLGHLILGRRLLIFSSISRKGASALIGFYSDNEI